MFGVYDSTSYVSIQPERTLLRVLVCVEDMTGLVNSSFAVPASLILYPGKLWLLEESPLFDFVQMGPRDIAATEMEIRRKAVAWLGRATPEDEPLLRRLAAQVCCAIVHAREFT
jgi:hypothetical protein